MACFLTALNLINNFVSTWSIYKPQRLSHDSHIFHVIFEPRHDQLSDALPPVLLPDDDPESEDVLRSFPVRGRRSGRNDLLRFVLSNN